jgi:uncharacterized protein YfdQ (DUF2303 family)
MDAEAIKKIEQLTLQANDRLRIGGDDQEFAFLEPLAIVNDKVIPLTQYLPGRIRQIGHFKTSVIDDFCDYIKTHTGKDKVARAFINDLTPVAKTYFDIHQDDNKYWGRGDHLAELQLKQTAAWSLVCSLGNNKYTQKDLIELIEDWAPNFDGGSNGETVLNQKQVIAGIRNITISQLTHDTNVERDLGARRTAIEDIQAQSLKETPIPTYLSFRCVPYHGLGERAVTLRVSVLTGSDKPMLTLRVVGMESVKEDIQNEFKAMLSTKLGKNVSELLIGTYEN